MCSEEEHNVVRGRELVGVKGFGEFFDELESNPEAGILMNRNKRRDISGRDKPYDERENERKTDLDEHGENEETGGDQLGVDGVDGESEERPSGLESNASLDVGSGSKRRGKERGGQRNGRRGRGEILDSPVRQARKGSSLGQNGQEEVDEWGSDGGGLVSSSVRSTSIRAELEGDELGFRSSREFLLLDPLVLVVLVLRE